MNHSRFSAAAVGLALGYIIGEHSETVAKLVLYLPHKGNYESWRVAETSLVILILSMGLAMYLGLRASKRDLVRDEDIILTLVTGLIVALFAIVNNSLPEPIESSGSPLSTGLYLIGWAIGLWLMPMFFIPNPERSYELWLQRGLRLAAITVTTSVVFLVFGLAVAEVFQSYLPDRMKNMILSQSGCISCGDLLDFWLIRPPIIYPILSTLLLVIFVPFWWKELWTEKKASSARYWWLYVSLTVVSVYAGLIGSMTYFIDESWAGNLFANSSFAMLHFALLIGGFPIVGFAVVLVSYLADKRIHGEETHLFWLLLFPGFALGFTIIAALGIAPIYRLAEASSDQLTMLFIAYAISGAVFGALLPVFAWLRTRLVDT